MDGMEESIWRDGRMLALPSLQEDIDTEICVIGLGGSGLSALEQFRQGGLNCVGLDRRGIAAGAAGANGGFLLAGLASFYHQAVARFGQERVRGIYELTRRELVRRYVNAPQICRQTGSLRIAADADEEADCARQIEALQRDGFAAQAYIGPEGRGLLIPDDGVFDPAAYWMSLARSLSQNAVDLYGNCHVVSVEKNEALSVAVTTADGRRITADTVLIAVDGGLEQLLPQLAAEVRSARLQMLATAPAESLGLARPVYYRDGHDYWLQREDGRVVLGGGRDIGGEDEWQVADGGTTTAVQAHLENLLRGRLGCTAPITHRWSARVAFTRRGLPVFGQIAPRVFVTGAYNGTGNIFGALCGRALAQVAMGQGNELAEWLA
jgi:gamma-glutamylputrescine oxidase